MLAIRYNFGIIDSGADNHPPYCHLMNSTPTSKKRPLDEKDVDYVFAMPVLPTPRKTKRQSPGILIRTGSVALQRFFVNVNNCSSRALKTIAFTLRG